MTARTTTRVVLSALAATTAATGFGLYAGTAHAATTTTQTLSYAAVEDTYSSSARPTFNGSAATTLVAGAAGADTSITFLKFHVPTLPA